MVLVARFNAKLPRTLLPLSNMTKMTFLTKKNLLSFIFLIAGCTLVASAQERPVLKTAERYRLQAGDILEVQYRYTPEFNDLVTIQPDGYVTLPLLGDIRFGGLNLEQARALIFEKAKVRLKDPEINLKLKEFVTPFVTVFGEVDKPGRVELHGKLTVVEALAVAGGFKDTAKHSQVVLFRKVDDEWAEAKEIDVKENMSKRTLTEDLTLRPGDLLYIPQNRISKIERVVRLSSLLSPLNLLLRR